MVTKILNNSISLSLLFLCLFLLQTFRHGFPHSPTALGYDPVQKLLAIGDKSGSLRMYPFSLKIYFHMIFMDLNFILPFLLPN